MWILGLIWNTFIQRVKLTNHPTESNENQPCWVEQASLSVIDDVVACVRQGCLTYRSLIVIAWGSQRQLGRCNPERSEGSWRKDVNERLDSSHHSPSNLRDFESLSFLRFLRLILFRMTGTADFRENLLTIQSVIARECNDRRNLLSSIDELHTHFDFQSSHTVVRSALSLTEFVNCNPKSAKKS